MGDKAPLDSYQEVTLNEILARCKPDFDRIEQAMEGHFSSHLPFVNQISSYILFAGGKRFRPLLTVYTARLCGGDGPDIYDLSVVPEYLHAASLLHDDVVDEGTLRRGKPPAYKVWGNKAAVLVGDYLYARAIDLASSFGNVLIAKAIAQTVALMSEGEIIQLLDAKAPTYTEEAYNKVIDRKTASLISVSCRIGALIAGAPENQVELVAEYGYNLGKAFQIIDDVLDYTADVKEFGKSLGTDLAEGKVTLPVIVALKNSSSQDQSRLKKLLEDRNPSEQDLAWIGRLLDETGGIVYAREKAIEHINKAVNCMDAFPGSGARQLLINLAWFVASRKK